MVVRIHHLRADIAGQKVALILDAFDGAGLTCFGHGNRESDDEMGSERCILTMLRGKVKIGFAVPVSISKNARRSYASAGPYQTRNLRTLPRELAI